MQVDKVLLVGLAKVVGGHRGEEQRFLLEGGLDERGVMLGDLVGRLFRVVVIPLGSELIELLEGAGEVPEELLGGNLDQLDQRFVVGLPVGEHADLLGAEVVPGVRPVFTVGRLPVQPDADGQVAVRQSEQPKGRGGLDLGAVQVDRELACQVEALADDLVVQLHVRVEVDLVAAVATTLSGDAEQGSVRVQHDGFGHLELPPRGIFYLLFGMGSKGTHESTIASHPDLSTCQKTALGVISTNTYIIIII